MSLVKSDIDKDYWFEKEIARGKSKCIHKATHRKTGKDYIIKAINKSMMSIAERV